MPSCVMNWRLRSLLSIERGGSFADMPMKLCSAIVAVLGMWSLLPWPLTTFHAMADLLEDKRVIIQAKHADAVRTFLELEPWEDATFWPVYEEYRADLARTNDLCSASFFLMNRSAYKSLLTGLLVTMNSTGFITCMITRGPPLDIV